MNEQIALIEQAASSGPAYADAVRSAETACSGGSHRVSQTFWAVGGFLCFALGMAGVVLPILPTTPFILVAAFCFARSSTRLNDWFKGTKVYKQVLEGYVTKRSMTLRAKLAILIPVTVLLAIGFALMGRVPVGRIILAAVWLGHIIYFGFIVKTDKQA
ncbi:MAG: YbaN family protein [Coriobacteriia bacterium]|nr:YbaN family protein [Coriobacteriia bacterium]